MSERTIKPTASHREFRDDAIALLRKHAGKLDAKDMLALSAHLVGQIAALQDQRTMTSEAVMQIVSKNIELGNQEAIESLLSTSGQA